MWQQKIIYEGNSSGLFCYGTFVQFMHKKGQHLASEITPLRKTEIYILQPATTLMYQTWKRVIPRGMDIWDVRVILFGYGIEEVEKNLQDLISEQKP